MAKGARWTSYEDRCLFHWWRAGIPAETLMKDFPGRTAKAIRQHASDIGAKRAKRGEDDEE